MFQRQFEYVIWQTIRPVTKKPLSSFIKSNQVMCIIVDEKSIISKPLTRWLVMLIYQSSGGWKEHSNQLFHSHFFPTSRALALLRYRHLYASLAEDVAAFGWHLLSKRAHTNWAREFWLLWWRRWSLWARQGVNRDMLTVDDRLIRRNPPPFVAHVDRKSSRTTCVLPVQVETNTKEYTQNPNKLISLQQKDKLHPTLHQPSNASDVYLLIYF